MSCYTNTQPFDDIVSLILIIEHLFSSTNRFKALVTNSNAVHNVRHLGRLEISFMKKEKILFSEFEYSVEIFSDVNSWYHCRFSNAVTGNYKLFEWHLIGLSA